MHCLLTLFYNSKRFDTAAAFLSRIICINGAQFRRMELLRRMKQTNQALLRLKNLQILQNVEDFTAYLPSEFEEFQKIHLPTRQYLEYILVKLQGIARLLCRVIDCGRKTGRHCLQLLSIGNFFAKNSIFLSVLGQVVAAAKERLDTIIHSFDKLLTLREKLKAGKLPWLPENYVYPLDLKWWLGEQYPSEPTRDDKVGAPMNPLSNLVSVGDDEEDGDAGDVSVNNESIFQAFKEAEEDPTDFGNDFIKFNNGSNDPEGLGEVVEREETLQDRLVTIKTVTDIQNFIKTEDLTRLQRNTTAFTSKVPKKQWSTFKSESNRLMKAFSGKTLVKKFKQELNKIIK